MTRIRGISQSVALSLIFLSLLTISCPPPESISLDDRYYYIAVVGEGVGGQAGKDNTRIYMNIRKGDYRKLNADQGHAMWKGVKYAFDNAGWSKDYIEYIKLIPFDDYGQTETSEIIANFLANDANVLAVIGHATTGTTASAINYYSSNNLVLLMPIATSPSAAMIRDKSNFRDIVSNSYFRMPPSDDKVQAPAVVYYCLNVLKSKKVYIIKDESYDAELYSGSLAENIRTLLGDRIVFEIERIDENRDGYKGFGYVFDSHNIDTVIFCGYGTTAIRFLYAVKLYYEENGKPYPHFMLTDGCKVSEILNINMNYHISFPSPTNYDNNNAAFDLFIKEFGTIGTQTYEIYSYDAMNFLITAISAIDKSELSRKSILRKLREVGRNYEGLTTHYDFNGGENSIASYYIYQYNRSDNGELNEVVHRITNDMIMETRSKMRRK